MKISNPLFGTTARGIISRVGSFRRARSGTYHIVTGQLGNRTNHAASADLNNHFAIAKAQHSAIVPTVISTPSGPRLRRVPSWPDYWEQYVLDNNLGVVRHANSGALIDDLIVQSSAGVAVVSNLEPGALDKITVAATATVNVELAASSLTLDEFTVQSTAHHQKQPP